MAEYINRSAFLENERRVYCETCKRRENSKGKVVYEIGEAPCRACGIGDVLDDLEDAPAADVRPVARGKWKKRIEEKETPYYKSFTPIWSCSECGTEYDSSFCMTINFCPNCGADMGEES